ncbi:uncharacterized protein LOC129265151 [Lytechinus pictus]|uniref:uncharacterized protein LOC129265151 n=1 Tax=Lytechinus pictus TaxID=7653 RepID=UPI0030BA1F93
MTFIGKMDSFQQDSEKRAKRSSYFEMLSSISSELDLMLNDLKKNESFDPTSPRSPRTVSYVASETKDRNLPRSSKSLSTSDIDEFCSTGVSSSSGSNHISAPEPLILLDPIIHNKSEYKASLSHSMPDNTLTMMTRLVHTKPIWYLPHTQRAAAAHYLQGQPVGTFVVRQARQKDKLSLTMKHPGSGKGPYIESYPIETTVQGVKLSKGDMVFPLLDNLIAYHMQTEAQLPCLLTLPKAVMAARNLREIQSLALLEEDFWKSLHSRPPTPKDLFNNVSLMHLSPTLSKPSMSVTSSMNKQQDQSNITYPADRLSSKADVPGMYGIINTTPPAIYANTNDNKDSMKPIRNSIHDLSTHGRSSFNPLASLQRPSSEFDRQDMRFSSASEFEFVTSTSEQRYPPPRCAPPPPPRGEEPFKMPPSSRYTWSLSSDNVQYCLPHDQPYLPPKQKSQEKSVLQNTGQDAYRTPAFDRTRKNPSVTSLITQQHGNYRTPPTPASCRQSKSHYDSQEPLNASRATEQIQNILQPLTTCSNSSSSSTEPVPWHALPEFDPLFCTSENREISQHTDIASDLMRDCLLGDIQYEIEELADSTNNNRNSDQMAPMSNYPVRTTCEIPNLIKVNDEDSEEGGTASDQEIEDILKNESLDSSYQSDSELNPSSSFSEGVAFTENENGNHLLLSQSLEFSTAERSEVEQSGEEDKKDDKRIKSGLSHFKKLRLLAKKSSRGATKKLHRISGKSKKRDASTDIQEAILRVAGNKSIGLGALLHGFIRTQEEKCESDKPDIVLRSIRQFMSGTKNYLLNKREPEIDVVIDRHMDELDLASLEAIVESALYQCVLEPLKSDIGMSCINEYNRNGSMALMDHNIMQAKKRTPEELGIKANYIPPEGEDLDMIRQLFSQLQEAYSPINKMDLLLNIVSAIYKSVQDRTSGESVTNSMGADDFLPMLIYVLVQCEMISIEIEADYMWGLLDPSMLSGEGGYYLTTLSSAICVLKQFEEDFEGERHGFLTVLVAVSQDPVCISLKTLPVSPDMQATQICEMLAHRMDLEDTQDYRLYLLRDSEEIGVEDCECPLDIKNEEESDGRRSCRFVFRPVHTEVNWPRTSGLR